MLLCVSIYNYSFFSELLESNQRFDKILRALENRIEALEK